MSKIVAIFGTGRARPGDQAYETAFEVGRALANAGFTIVNGGYGGTMLASAKGASQAGGAVIGVTCTAFKRSRPNEFVTQERSTDSLDQRLDTLLELADDYVVLAGGTGTLLELAKVWELKNKGFLDERKRVILVGGFWQPLIGLVVSEDAGSGRYLLHADGGEDVVSILQKRE